MPKVFLIKVMIKRVNTTHWREFKYEQIFDSITRGRRLVESDRISGDLAYYSASKKNNALTDSIANPLFIEKNSIIYTTFGDCFYVDGEFTASDEISIFKHPKLNLYNGLFLATIIKKNKNKYTFGRKAFNNKYSKNYILIPAKKNINGDYEPDWQFMEDYIKAISKKVDFSDTIQVNSNKLLSLNTKTPDTSNWQEFELQVIFNIRSSKSSFTKDEVNSGKHLYITTSNKNNGVSGTSDIYTEVGNVITVDSATDGKAFYQESNFIGSDHVELLEPYNFVLNKNIGIFIISILNLQMSKYGFGRKRSQIRLKKEVIKLPAKQNSNGKYEPDWQFMEDYIKSLPYSSNL